MMNKIIVILPSKNESVNIAHITKIVDIGLSTYYQNVKSLILNIDSSSSDNTVEIFKSVHTKTQKKSLILGKEEIGKGFNLKAGIQYGLLNNYQYFMTVDSDVKSIEPYWISSYLDRLILFSDDFVVPIYKRNRYEGNTTNHFSSPLFYLCFGIDVQQPIAGDFAFNRSIAERILNAFEVPSDYGYGVDTMMTWTALMSTNKFSQIHLGRKLHNPSFSKIIDIFSQVCFSTLYRINKHRETVLEILGSGSYCLPNLQPNLDIDYCLRPDDGQIEKIRRFAQDISRKNSTIDNEHFENIPFDSDAYLNQLSSCILSVLVNSSLSSSDISLITNHLLSLYLLRVISYFDFIDNVGVKNISQYWVEQKLKLVDIIKSRLLFERSNQG
jgi:hypothetical protein